MKYWELSKFTLEKLLDEKNVLGIMNIEGVKIVHKVDRPLHVQMEHLRELCCWIDITKLLGPQRELLLKGVLCERLVVFC